MKRKLLVLAAVLAVACWVGVANANTFTYYTPAGATESGGSPVNAQAAVTTSNYDAINHPYNVEIVLTNNLADPKNIAQCLSDFAFVLTDFNQLPGAISENPSKGGATPVTVASNGTFTLGTPIVGTSGLGWNFSETSLSATTFLLDVLGGAGPTNLIIGSPGSGGVYGNANASIAGNGPHNPLLSQSADFFLYVPGVSSTTGNGGATFSFGTTCGDNITVAPIPPTALLLGTGLLGLVGFGWRRKRG